jgi:hypothetical protein
MNLIPHCHIPLILTSVSIFSAQCFPSGLLRPGSPVTLLFTPPSHFHVPQSQSVPVTRTLSASQPPPGSPTTVCTGHPHPFRFPATSRFPDHSVCRSPTLFSPPSHLQVRRPRCLPVTRTLPAAVQIQTRRPAL